MSAQTITPRWPLALDEPARRAAHLGIKAEDLEAAGEYGEAARIEQLAATARADLLTQVHQHILGDLLTPEDLAWYDTRRTTGQIMRAAYAHVRSETR